MGRLMLLTSAAALMVATAVAMPQNQSAAASPLPMPRFHHIHLNSVNPERSLDWYSQYRPQGKKTTLARFPAFYDNIYLLYTKVGKQPPGAFDRKQVRGRSSSKIWTGWLWSLSR